MYTTIVNGSILQIWRLNQYYPATYSILIHKTNFVFHYSQIQSDTYLYYYAIIKKYYFHNRIFYYILTLL